MRWLRPRFEEDVREEPGRGRVHRLRLTRRTRTQLVAAFPLLLATMAFVALLMPVFALRNGVDVPQEAFLPAMVLAGFAVLVGVYSLNSLRDYVEVDRFGVRHHHRTHTQNIPWGAIEEFLVVGSSSSDFMVVYPAMMTVKRREPLKLTALGAHSRARAVGMARRLAILAQEFEFEAVDERLTRVTPDDLLDEILSDMPVDQVDDHREDLTVDYLDDHRVDVVETHQPEQVQQPKAS